MRIWKIGIIVSLLPPVAFILYLAADVSIAKIASSGVQPIMPIVLLLFLFPLSAITFPYYWWKIFLAFWNKKMPRQSDWVGMLVCVLCMLAVLKLGATVGIDIFAKH